MSIKKKLNDFLELDLHAVQNLLKSEYMDWCLKTESGLAEQGDVDKENLMQETETDLNLQTTQRCPPDITEEETPSVVPEVTPINQAELRKIINDFVDVYERLDTSDDVSRKPNYSYTELIFLAIMRSPNFCLPIHEIYLYIETRFTFFRKYTREHWKNAVRHSLSKTRCFTKIGIKKQSKSSVLSRSCYLWTIYPISVLNFARGDYRPNIDQESGTNTLRWGFYQVNAFSFWKQCVVAVSERLGSFQQMLDGSPDPARIFNKQACCLPELGQHEGVHFSSIDQVPSPTMAIKREYEEGDDMPNPSCKRSRDLSPNTLYCSPSTSPGIRGTAAVGDVLISTLVNKDYNASLNASASGSDSETSFTASSNDSGRDTLSDISLSSPEEIYQRLCFPPRGCVIIVPTFGAPTYTDDRQLPEVQFDSIRDIPVIPELPPLQLAFERQIHYHPFYQHSYNPCPTDASTMDDVAQYTDCMFQSQLESRDSTDTTREFPVSTASAPDFISL